jgi:uncharacterized membrane protein
VSSNPPDDYNAGRRELELAEESPTEVALERLEPYLLPNKAQEARTILARMVSKSHSGPIPSAEELEHLERTLPGSANRCFEMAEREQLHRHGVTDTIIDREFALRGRGQFLALVALILLLIIVGFFAYLGDTQAAAWLGSATIVGVVAIFATGKIIEAKEDMPGSPPEATPQPASLPGPNQRQIASQSRGKGKRRR